MERIFQALKRPHRIQEFLETRLAYNHASTCFSPAVALREGRAHCMEGALVAAAALRALGHPPLLLDLEAERDDDHVLAVFKIDGCWGAIAKSNYAGLRYREPVYRTLRELAMSYFDCYYNLKGERSLRAYSTRPVHLARFDRKQWMTSAEEVWYIPEHLVTIPHTPLLTPTQRARLTRLDHRAFQSGLAGRTLDK
jgi:hypothetical protein